MVPVTSWDQADPSRPTNDTTVTNVCADHFVDFVPGTYNNLQAMNNLMQNCPAYTTYWFEPGSYYFDFVDVGTATYRYWREPVNYSQIVAGSIPAPGSGHEWKPCGNCAQPTHTMTPNKIDPSGWGQDLNADGDYSDAGEDGSPDKGNLIDNKWAYVTMNRSGSTNANISQRTSHTPLLPTATVQNVKFAIHETHDAINSVSCATGQPAGTCNPWDGPNGNVKVRLQVTRALECVVRIPGRARQQHDQHHRIEHGRRGLRHHQRLSKRHGVLRQRRQLPDFLDR